MYQRLREEANARRMALADTVRRALDQHIRRLDEHEVLRRDLSKIERMAASITEELRDYRAEFAGFALRSLACAPEVQGRDASKLGEERFRRIQAYAQQVRQRERELDEFRSAELLGGDESPMLSADADE